MVINESLLISRNPESIWSYWMDVTNDVHWRNGITKAEWTSQPPYGIGSTGEHIHEKMGAMIWEITRFEDARSFEFLHLLAKMMMEFSLAQLDLLVEAGLDVLVIEDDIAMDTGPMISLEHFKFFINHYNQQIVEKAHQKGLKVGRHSDGNLWPLLDVLLETGYDGLNPLEPQAGMDMKKIKAYCGDKICLLGNIDCVGLLPKGNTKQVEQAVIQTIEDGASGGGLIICSSNSLHQGVNPENCIAMFEAARKHGQYI
jgi:uroporphyrinogen decarboxylase